MPTFLLEIGTEELPADFARLVIPQLREIVERDFLQKRLEYKFINCTTTPRRIVLLVDGLASSASDFEEELKGPPATIAFKDGKPTQSAVGFAKRLGVDINSLQTRETSKGDFVFAKKIEKGQSALDLLKELIPEWISLIQGSRFMRWGTSDRKFSRPIRWIVSLLDNELIPIKISDSDPVITANRFSRGHRLFSDVLKINSAEVYSDLLFKDGVHVFRNKRKIYIEDLIQDKALELKAETSLSNSLLEELTDLVENPSILVGSISESFLDLPAEVLSTVMEVHQRYIPIYKKNSKVDRLSLNARKNLLPYFLCISNGLKNAELKIKSGNEKVLNARLADAEFFLKADLKTSSEFRRSQLSKVMFAEGLGSLLDRVNRIEWITGKLTKKLKLNNDQILSSRKAAYFSKNDLVSQMVGEFPELQGIMGGKYLMAEGNSKDVALAVVEQYFPKGSRDQVPESIPGSILAVADRIELLLSIFAKGEKPSGSSDPYALRRAGNGILQILWTNNWDINLFILLEECSLNWNTFLEFIQVDRNTLFNQLCEFFRYRIISLLEEENIDIDIIQSVAGSSVKEIRLLENVNDVRYRAKLLASMRKEGELNRLQAIVTRASRLAEKGSLPINILDPSDVVDEDLFEKSSEKSMFDKIINMNSTNKDFSYYRYQELIKELIEASNVLEDFFDGTNSVLVMTEDLKMRTNRLNLLGLFRNNALLLADFSKLNG